MTRAMKRLHSYGSKASRTRTFRTRESGEPALRELGHDDEAILIITPSTNHAL